MAYALDLFTVLAGFDRNDLTVYESLSEDPTYKAEMDKNVGWLFVQWMTGANDDTTHRRLLVKFNDLANQGWGKFSKHPALQAKLLASAGLGHRVKHKFYKPRPAK